MAQTIDLGNVVGPAGKDGIQIRRFFLRFPADGWTEQEDGSCTQTAGAEGMLETDAAHVDIDMRIVTAESYADVNGAWAKVARAQTMDGGMTLTCFGGAPETDLPVMVEVMR